MCNNDSKIMKIVEFKMEIIIYELRHRTLALSCSENRSARKT